MVKMVVLLVRKESLSHEERGAIRDIYEEHVFEHCHHQW